MVLKNMVFITNLKIIYLTALVEQSSPVCCINRPDMAIGTNRDGLHLSINIGPGFSGWTSSADLDALTIQSSYFCNNCLFFCILVTSVLTTMCPSLSIHQTELVPTEISLIGEL